MPLPWLKLYTRFLNEPWAIALSDSTYRRWMEMLLLAGDIDEDGRLDTLPLAALAIRCSEESLAAAVKELSGRVAVRRGVLYIRDWSDWQPPRKAKESPENVRRRVAEHRARTAEAGDLAQEEPPTIEVCNDDVTVPLHARNGDVTTPSRVCARSTSSSNSKEEKEDVAPRPPTPQQERFGAVAEMCGFDWRLVDAVTKHGLTRLASDLGKTDPAWIAGDIRAAGEEWYTVKFRSRSRAEVTPPTVAQAKTWLGQCRVRWLEPSTRPARKWPPEQDWTSPGYVGPEGYVPPEAAHD